MGRVGRIALAAAVVAVLAGGLPLAGSARHGVAPGVKLWKIHYRAHNGTRRAAYVLLPSWYGKRDHPSIPLIISPHGRGITGRQNARIWGNLPARGSFGVISPDGEGRVLGAYSWGALGQIDDLARMPKILRLTLPWAHIDSSRIYAFGGSMGGQEALLLLARHPRLLAGVASFDAVTDFALQYHDFDRLGCGKSCEKTWNGPIGSSLRQLAVQEVGGSPAHSSYAWRLRSPITYAGAIAASCVPLQLWWSRKDSIVVDQQRQSKRLYERIVSLNRLDPVTAFQGYWRHSAEMRAGKRLPLALSVFGLLPGDYPALTRQINLAPAPPTRCGERGVLRMPAPSVPKKPPVRSFASVPGG